MAAGLIVSAPASGAGKTVLTLALLRAFRRRGAAVSSFKAGPDYIDPAFHAAATGRPCASLDLWAMRPETFRTVADDAAAGAELVIGEGAMGLFDGAAGGGGSTADIAAALGLPVVLALDVRGQGASVAAVAAGFRDRRADIAVAGAILNRVGGERHRAILEAALRDVVPVLGAAPRDDRLTLPERHLGLVQAGETADLDGFLDRAAALVAETVDLDSLAALARPWPAGPARRSAPPLEPPGQRIAVARDTAFAFAYPALLEGWRRAGAQIAPFSPLADEPPAHDADAVWLPGGYPELHAGRIAANGEFLTGLRAAAARGAAVLGECGGFMALGEGLIDREGRRHAMAGLLPVVTAFDAPRLHLGYRRMALAADGPLGRAGAAFRGHEFHYARLRRREGPPLFHVSDAQGRALGSAGAVSGRVAGSFLHLVDRETA